ncbi:MAG TPA: hypothetical protein VED16_01085 [Candidatus Acidoferrum sp.]|nr:hypothetical protein [Candidatus Acidoferrum sp.]
MFWIPIIGPWLAAPFASLAQFFDLLQLKTISSTLWMIVAA